MAKKRPFLEEHRRGRDREGETGKERLRSHLKEIEQEHGYNIRRKVVALIKKARKNHRRIDITTILQKARHHLDRRRRKISSALGKTILEKIGGTK